MRKIFAVLCITVMLTIAIPALAADVLLNAKIDNVTQAIDKNGNEYIRFIVTENRMLQGVEYQVGVAVMAFRGTVTQAKSLSEGDTLKAVCTEREYKGRKSYTILKILE